MSVPPGRRGSSARSRFPRYLVGACTCLILLPGQIAAQVGLQMPTFDKHLEQFLQPVKINGGASYRQPIQVSVPSELTGQVKAYGGSGHDIRVQVFYGDRMIFNSGQRHLVDVDVKLPWRGEYWIVFDNSFSIVSSKLVWNDLNVYEQGNSAAPRTSSVNAPSPFAFPDLTFKPNPPKLPEKLPADHDAPMGEPLEVVAERLFRETPSETRGEDWQGPSPDRWRGLILDQSSPDDAKTILGEPSEARFALGLDAGPFASLLAASPQGYSCSTYTHVDSHFSNVRLCFGDERLLLIDLRFQDSLTVNEVCNAYKIRLIPFSENLHTLPPDKPTSAQFLALLGIYNGNLISVTATSNGDEAPTKAKAERLQLVSGTLVSPVTNDKPNATEILK